MEREEVSCSKDCTCKPSLSHYLTVLGGFLRLVSIVVGIVFSAEAADVSSKAGKTKSTIDNIVELVEKITAKLE